MKLFEKLNLSGTKSWMESQKQSVHDLIIEFGHLFDLDDLDLGKTSLVRHTIKYLAKKDTSEFHIPSMRKLGNI